jgi:hypothetical protein
MACERNEGFIATVKNRVVQPGVNSPVEEPAGSAECSGQRREMIPSKHSGLWFSSDEKKPADGSSKGSRTNPNFSPGLPFLRCKLTDLGVAVRESASNPT